MWTSIEEKTAYDFWSSTIKWKTDWNEKSIKSKTVSVYGPITTKNKSLPIYQAILSKFHGRPKVYYKSRFQ